LRNLQTISENISIPIKGGGKLEPIKTSFSPTSPLVQQLPKNTPQDLPKGENFSWFKNKGFLKKPSPLIEPTVKLPELPNPSLPSSPVLSQPSSPNISEAGSLTPTNIPKIIEQSPSVTPNISNPLITSTPKGPPSPVLEIVKKRSPSWNSDNLEDLMKNLK
jgi:hypothetical protein